MVFAGGFGRGDLRGGGVECSRVAERHLLFMQDEFQLSPFEAVLASASPFDAIGFACVCLSLHSQKRTCLDAITLIGR